ncbi:tetraacyldisaccharide 4'-kinase [Daejeonella oryzae]|uniref:tetraacyldisaccharide 4'-kinase n=1 Tax=Daejeonella oryzae TaxID=1122943 RepID=UPI000478BEDE|nr:tetraacyldisaccharide 4'-kinase [Daejeonella oryzae]
MKLLRLLLFPFSLFYGLCVILRNLGYDLAIFRSRKFKIPVISVGNLAVGGAGKSPMTEYLVALLKQDFRIAILSRGYGRKTKGFFKVNTASLADDVGDEPLQFKQKFPELTVAVCEDRVEGIKELNKAHELIILDDAFQHRAVRPGFSILLFDYNSVSHFQWLLPSGNLREPLYGRKRANLIIITKTSPDLPDEARRKMIKRIAPFPHQKIFFSYLEYGKLQSFLYADKEMDLEIIQPQTHILLLTGIANPLPLINELKKYSQNIVQHNYPDHHRFSKENILKLVADFKSLPGTDKLIISTEKDVQRLKTASIIKLIQDLPVYYLPVKAEIHQPDKAEFNDLIKKYVTEHAANHRIHKT